MTGVIATACVLAGCSSTDAPTAGTQVRPGDDANLLAGCGPLSDQVIAGTVNALSVQRQGGSACTWSAAEPGGRTTALAYVWSREDSLAREVDAANRQGYRIEKLVIKRFGGMYVRDPRNPGACAVTVADTGAVTWRADNRDHAALPDPCAAAMSLMQATLSVDGV